MGQSFSLGRISGIRIGVNWSVLVIVALLAYGLAAGQFPAEVPRRPEAEYVVAAIVTAVAYMGSLLAHELAHSLVARRNGVQVEGITLWLLGGVSRLQGEIPDPGAEVRVAGVGPLTSLVLGGVFTLVAPADRSGYTELSRLRKQWQARAERGEIPQFGANVTASIIFVLAVTFILLA